ncbi:MAG: hypothetical protein V4697_02220 [Patescibacteria group bacterium]
MPAKKIVQDIVPGQKKSIRSIALDREVEPALKAPRRRVTRPRIEDEDVPVAPPRETIQEERIEEMKKEVPRERPTKKKKGGKNIVLGFIIILLCLGLIATALSLLYSKAVVTITPRTANFSIDGTFTAKKDPVAGELGYEVITATDDLKETIPATAGPLVQTKAKGTAVIYNNYSSAPQTLIAGTRLSTPEGLIYRTATSIVVPGKKTAPGSISVNIVADQVGANYNTKVADLSGDFKIVGYQGTPKYSAFYGRLKTDVTGGFSGNKMVIASSTKATATTELQEKIKANLIAELKNSLPEGYLLYDTAYIYEYTTSEPVMKDASTAELSMKATAYAVIFKADTLLKFIAGKEIQKFPSTTFRVEGDKELAFKISNTKDLSLKKGTSVIFTLKGPLKVVGTFSEEKLKEELKGISLKDSNAVFASYPAIKNAYALLMPFWMRSFPNSTESIILEFKPE